MIRGKTDQLYYHKLSRIKYLFPRKYVTNINSIKKRETHQFHSVNYKGAKKNIPQIA